MSSTLFLQLIVGILFFFPQYSTYYWNYSMSNHLFHLWRFQFAPKLFYQLLFLYKSWSSHFRFHCHLSFNHISAWLTFFTVFVPSSDKHLNMLWLRLYHISIYDEKTDMIIVSNPLFSLFFQKNNCWVSITHTFSRFFHHNNFLLFFSIIYKSLHPHL